MKQTKETGNFCIVQRGHLGFFPHGKNWADFNEHFVCSNQVAAGYDESLENSFALKPYKLPQSHALVDSRPRNTPGVDQTFSPARLSACWVKTFKKSPVRPGISWSLNYTELILKLEFILHVKKTQNIILKAMQKLSAQNFPSLEIMRQIWEDQVG